MLIFLVEKRGVGANNAVIGHYTQFVWAKSNKIGCGVCSYNGGESYDRLTMMCDYGPAGNVYQQAVYKTT